MGGWVFKGGGHNEKAPFLTLLHFALLCCSLPPVGTFVIVSSVAVILALVTTYLPREGGFLKCLPPSAAAVSLPILPARNTEFFAICTARRRRTEEDISSDVDTDGQSV